MTTLSVVIPAYNEENGIADIVQRVLAVRPTLQTVGVHRLELLVVDDGSADSTAQITRELADADSDLRLIQHPTNKGYGAALKTGFGQASGDLIGFLDADGTYPPEHFPQLCEKALNGSELVIGSRMSGSDTQMPLTRKIGNRFFAGLLSLLGRRSISDSASGMRVFKRDILQRLYPLPDGLNLTPVMSTRAVHEQVAMSEVPIPYAERVGRSKLSVIHDGSLFLRSMVWTVLKYNPVRILGTIGLALLVVALVCGVWLIALRLSGVTQLEPIGVALTIWGAIAAMVGVSVTALGITFNYLVALFHKEPVRQGLFIRPIFQTQLDRHFGWVGLMSILVGAAIGTTALVLSTQGWAMERLWLYGLGSAMSVVIGVELCIFWILLRVLEELADREARIASEFPESYSVTQRTTE